MTLLDHITFHGPGLHTGVQCSLVLARAPGPLCFIIGEDEIDRSLMRALRADYGVELDLGGRAKVDLVEHLFAAFAGLSIQHGVRIVAGGPEIPLLDGGAREFAAALQALGPPRSPPQLRVVQAGEVITDRSRYSFEPQEGIHVGVEVDFSPFGTQRASWDGSSAAFLSQIAPARTFGFRSDARRLRASGRATHVDPSAVIVIEDDGSVLPPFRPPEDSELARHKLLDLLGDLFLFGGPPVGKLFAQRPGHRASHRAIEQALEFGLLERIQPGVLRPEISPCGVGW